MDRCHVQVPLCEPVLGARMRWQMDRYHVLPEATVQRGESFLTAHGWQDGCGSPVFSLGDPSWQSNSLIWPLPSTHPGPALFFINAPAASHPHTENQPSSPASARGGEGGQWCQLGLQPRAAEASVWSLQERKRRVTSPLLPPPPPPSFYCIAFG